MALGTVHRIVLEPRAWGHSCGSHSTNLVLGAEPAFCLADAEVPIGPEAEGLRERGVEARTCLGRLSPHTAGQSALCSRQQVVGSCGWKALTPQSSHQPRLEPPLPLTQHVQGSLPTSRLGWPCSRPHRKWNRLGTSRGCSALLCPCCFWTPSGDHSPQAPACGRGALGGGWLGTPRERRGPCSCQPHWFRGQTLLCAQLH